MGPERIKNRFRVGARNDSPWPQEQESPDRVEQDKILERHQRGAAPANDALHSANDFRNELSGFLSRQRPGNKRNPSGSAGAGWRGVSGVAQPAADGREHALEERAAPCAPAPAQKSQAGGVIGSRKFRVAGRSASGAPPLLFGPGARRRARVGNARRGWRAYTERP